MTAPRVFCIGSNYSDHIREIGLDALDEGSTAESPQAGSYSWPVK
jgi:2-keto-4-pentenoate hydratase/2-oxohepta-3-ene-1,7-dioic acid hydratase in catechol pathway